MTDSPATDQAAVFRRLRVRLLRNALQSLGTNGRVKLATLCGTSLLAAGFVFGIARYGFQELFRYNVPLKGLIVGGLFDLLFFTLGGMLVISTGIILYASLFTSPEARFLLTTPARADRVFATKFQAAVGFSSWAFVVLGVPILVAYGSVAGVPGYYYLLLPAYLLGFVLLPGSVSSLAALLLVRFLPRNRKQALLLLGAVAALLAGAWGVRLVLSLRQTARAADKEAVAGLIGQFALAQSSLVPSHWMTNGLMAAARNDLPAALVPLALLWSNGLALFTLAAWGAKRVYRTGFDRATDGGRGKKTFRHSPLDRVMSALVFYLDRPTRVLVLKDFRTFRRDPTQWVLLAIFGGMVLIGGLQLRNISQSDLATLEKYAVSLANVGATSVLLCAVLSRFVFPLISLEGRKFWILGLVPISRNQILRGKFAFAATLSVVLAEGLILISDLLLELPAVVVLVHAVTLLAVAVGLSGLNVGLGAYMPNFRETDPSKIVVGFGGTVNMMIGLCYLVLVVGISAGPLHAAAVAAKYQTGQLSVEGSALPLWAFAGVPVALALAAVATVIPLRAGGRALRAVEF
ncbi:MAG TPA: hypothetical protein VGJ05_07945 [Fimbriiglobus sp.]